MTVKTPQQLRTEQIRRRQQALQQRQQTKPQSAATLALSNPKPKPKAKPRPAPAPVQNSAVKIDPTPWLEQFDKTAYVIGGGPSLVGFKWELLKDRFVVGINRAYEVLPSAQVIYFTDDDWYGQHKAGLCNHSGLKIKGSLNPNKLGQVTHIHQFHLTGPNGLDMNKGCLRHGSNSTYAVLNMLCQWGFKTIYLLGVDMKWKIVNTGGNKGNKKTHWHNGHKRIDGEALYTRLNKNFQQLAPLLKQQGVNVINVNNDTNLAAFPVKKYEEVFGPGCFR